MSILLHDVPLSCLHVSAACASVYHTEEFLFPCLNIVLASVCLSRALWPLSSPLCLCHSPTASLPPLSSPRLLPFLSIPLNLSSPLHCSHTSLVAASYRRGMLFPSWDLYTYCSLHLEHSRTLYIHRTQSLASSSCRFQACVLSAAVQEQLFKKASVPPAILRASECSQLTPHP